MKTFEAPYTLVSLLALMAPTAAYANAQPPSTVNAGSSEQINGLDRREIVVTANPPVIAALSDMSPEQTYDSDRLAAYAVSTVGEAVDEIAAKGGDDRPALLVNGQPVQNRAIEDYPTEAIARIDVLPRGSAQRIGGEPGQRAYNIVLRRQATSITATFGHKLATEGHWNEESGEVLLTRIRDGDRFNLSLRGSSSGLLRESNRGIVQPQQDYPYDPIGNIIPAPGSADEIDPPLSALAGFPVSVAAVPANSLHPSLGDFIAGGTGTSGRANTIDLGHYRSLRQASRNFDSSLAWTKQIAPWLAASVAGNLEWGESHGLAGLPSALFLVTADNANTPFSRDVLLARSDPARPLQIRSHSDGGSLSLNFDANFGQWHASLGGGYDSRTVEYRNDIVPSGALPGFIVLDPQRNPFDPSLGSLIPVSIELSRSHTTRYQVLAYVGGPVFALPAGAVRVRATVLAGRSTLTPTGSFGSTPFSRTDVTEQVGITVPITGHQKTLPPLGDIELSFDIARTELSGDPSLDRYSWAVAWQLRRWLRINGGFTRTRNAVDLGMLAAPERVYQNVRTYDPVRDETVDVTYVSGGNRALRPETDDVYRVALSATPLPRYNLQLQAEYTATRSRDLIGAVSTASAAVMAAFPDRFMRDVAGQLVGVDGRPVNFSSLNEQALRSSIGFIIPLYHLANPSEGSTQQTGESSTPDMPKPRIEVNFSHSILLHSTAVIRPGLPPIDLLDGGAIDTGGGRPRHLINGAMSLTDRGTGIRLTGSWRSPATLLVGADGANNRLRFEALATFDLTLFARTQRLFPGSSWAENGRISLSVTNIANARERVIDSQGLTPLSYQPAYLDAVGRTIMLELRKVF